MRELLCESATVRLADVTASSERAAVMHAGRSCLDSQLNDDGLGGQGRSCMIYSAVFYALALHSAYFTRMYM